VATATAASGGAGRSRLLVHLRLTKQGTRLLGTHLGGIQTTVRGRAILTNGAARVARRVERRSILEIERFTSPPGSWVPDQPILTPTGLGFIQSLRGKLIAVAHIRCVGYAALDPGDPIDPYTLSLARAQLIRALLLQLGASAPAQIVGRGATHPIATNANESGRRRNRRVTVTLIHTPIFLRP
jgi:hypothetical protein